jgi:hypothetical protein
MEVEEMELWRRDPGDNGQMEVEEMELWRRDPVECVKELIGNPAFRKVMKYAPERVFKDAERKVRIYDEAWTADFWWEIQVRGHLALVKQTDETDSKRKSSPQAAPLHP